MIELAKTGEAAKAGPIGLAIILLLCIACYFLFKSMSKHMRKVREDFPDQRRVEAPPTTDAAPRPRGAVTGDQPPPGSAEQAPEQRAP